MKEMFLAVMIGYVLGSIPFALVIGKLFYKTDIRQYGSKNLGGGNAGRVLGKRAGLMVMTLDILKVSLAIYLAACFFGTEAVMIAAGTAAGLGHCFPVFAGFRGGKAVATLYGFLFGMSVIGPYSLWIFVLPLLVFLLILYVTKIIALASIGSAIFIMIYLGVRVRAWSMTVAALFFTVIILMRHKNNLIRIREGKENTISWM